MISTLIHFRIEMDIDSDQVETVRKIEEVKSDEEITDLELNVKIEKSGEKGSIKTEVFEEKNDLEPLQIIGEKRKNQEKSNLENETKKKEEYGVFEDLDYQEEPQEIQEIDIDDLDNQVSEISLH
jgi:hypothetical protein